MTALTRRIATPLVVAIASGLALLGVTPADASTGIERSFNPIPGVVRAPLQANSMRDRILPESMPRQSGPGGGEVAERAYFTRDRSRVRIRVSDAYVQDRAEDQALADFLGSLTHGPELNNLHVNVVTPRELNFICGFGTVACYGPSEQLMFVVGQDAYAGVPTNFAIAHEYGHHIATNRINPPGDALNLGTKRWASYESVCRKLDDGSLSTGPNAYWNFPGEAYAEAYAFSQVRSKMAWYYSPNLAPDATAYRKIRMDVLHPWTTDRRRSRSGMVGTDARTFHIRTPLDGRLELDLSGERGRGLDLRVRQGAHVVAASIGPDSEKHISKRICGARRFEVEVTGRTPAAHFNLDVLRP